MRHKSFGPTPGTGLALPFDHLVAPSITGLNAMPRYGNRREVYVVLTAELIASRSSPDSVDQFDAVDTGKLLSGGVKSRFVTTIAAVQWHIAAPATT